MIRFFQFRLRTLLIVVTVLSLYLGWLVHRAKEQCATVAAIQDLGGWIYYDFQIVNDRYDPNASSWAPEWLRRHLGIDFFHDVVQVNMVYNEDGPQRLDNAITTDASAKFIARLPRVELLGLKEGQATDSALRELSNLRRLHQLYMWDAAQVTDAGIAELRHLTQLKHVHCSNAQLTDESLKTFSTMPQLEYLSLQGNLFTDRGVAYLVDMPNLTELWIGTKTIQVTDEGLKSTARIEKLKVLDVQEAPITLDGLRTLLSGRPGLKVYHALMDKLKTVTPAGNSNE
jgi:hypothetical protein